MLRSILLALALLAAPAGAAEPRSAFGAHREAAEFGLRVVLGTPLGTTDPARDCVQMLGGGQRAEQAARGSAGRAAEGELARFIERGYRDAAQFCLMSAHLACRSAESGARGSWPSPEHCATVRSLRARYGS